MVMTCKVGGAFHMNTDFLGVISAAFQLMIDQDPTDTVFPLN